MSFENFRCWSRLSMSLLLSAAISLSFVVRATAEDKGVHIPLPKRTKPTPVQKLNREGVKAIDKHQYEKARKLFYEAYLLDPNDPFTLNNLGYISELEGNVDRASRYYDLAQQQSSEATVAVASTRSVEGKPVSQVAGNAAETGMQINRINIAAISLLQKDRAPEADVLLQKGLELDAHNPFTLNNIGFAREKEGELESALGYYTAAANVNSRDPIVVTVNKDWRGRGISEVAAENASKLRKEIGKQQSLVARVARLNLQGVSAMNRNERGDARKYFQQAYQLDPNDAFTLNNMGFLSELDGDRETADFYYQRAQEAKRRNATVTAATRADVEGRRVEQVADATDKAIDERMKADQEARRREGGPIELRPRPGSQHTVPRPENPPPAHPAVPRPDNP
jgi:Flp pilus assembly protein TadD